MKYAFSETFTFKARELLKKLNYSHIPAERVSCIISKGTKTRRTIARIHALGKAMQLGMQEKPFYVIELMEPFFRESEEDQTKTLIHELMHVPHNFGGGFRHHKPFVTKNKVEQEFERLKRL
ncbi:MAG: metallopeptidase [Candidatus Diapherotrites archaeon CG10_big_fil_rev_8_21_14_0_10_31_34]|nr:MAG: metallopeptidase [Candidatus Diapherotrites archaeon CG10_big_fil_rev_8_21_14_0_10_31_34]